MLQDKLLKETGWPHSPALLLPVTLVCAHDYVSVSLVQANAATKDKSGVPFAVCSCVASVFKAWAGPLKMKELKKLNNSEVILVIENLQIKDILVRDLEFSRKCKRKRNPNVLKFPEPHGHLSWTLVSLLGHQGDYPAGLCSNCSSNNLFTWESCSGEGGTGFCVLPLSISLWHLSVEEEEPHSAQ